MPFSCKLHDFFLKFTSGFLNKVQILRFFVLRCGFTSKRNRQHLRAQRRIFIAQMAQFNTLDQTRLMQSDIAGLRSQFKGSQANQFLGQWVSLQDPATLRTVEGLVTEVRFNGGNPQLVVGDVPYDLSRVNIVRAPEVPDLKPAGSESLPKADSFPSIPLSAT